MRSKRLTSSVSNGGGGVGWNLRKLDQFDSKMLQNEKKKIFAANKSFLPRMNFSE